MAYGVDDIDAVTADLRAAGCGCCTTSRGAAPPGSRVNFVHPKDAMGVLVELVQAAPH